jgi:MscS family membrane protein
MAIFWAALRVIDTSSDYVLHLPDAHENAAARSLAPLAGRIAKVVVMAIGAIAVLSELGYPVASLIAGLGIGGVALALAAQKTVENLFGSISIGLDRPFRVGDYVNVENVVAGTVEAIGLRSTRIRTLDRTVVTIPNGKLADMRVETYAARDRMRLFCVLGVTYGTTAAQIREIVDGVKRVLRAHPKIWPDSVIVRLKTFGPSSLDIDVMAWFQTTNVDEFDVFRQETMLQMMQVIESAGSSFAFPTQTLHLLNAGTAGAVEGALPPTRPLRGGATPESVTPERRDSGEVGLRRRAGTPGG